MRRAPLNALALSLALLAGACGESSPTDPAAEGDDPAATRTVLADPSFETHVQEIFDRKGCASSSCHGSAQSAGLDLRRGSSYGELVNAASTQTGGDRVVPGDAENSYLVVKVEGRQSVGSRMPIGGTPLDSIDLANLRNWIERGALDN